MYSNEEYLAGRSVPSLRFFEFYVSSCKSPHQKEMVLEKLSNVNTLCFLL